MADRRVALIIGNSGYLDIPALENPRNDAQDVAAALKRLGFETTVSLDADRDAMQTAIDEFSAQVEGADVALFYYAGHAMQHQSVNYLMPTDASITSAAGLRRMVRLDRIASDVKRAKGLRIMVIDACRDNPLADRLGTHTSSASATRSAGLAKMRTMAPPKGETVSANADRGGDIIVYAAEAGRTAADGAGRNSPFSHAFVKYVETEGQEIVSLMRRVTNSVHEETNGAQRPELSIAVPFEFYFKPGPPVAPPTVQQIFPNARPYEIGGIESRVDAIVSAAPEAERDLTRREVMAVLLVTAARSGLTPGQIAQELPQSYARLIAMRDGVAQARVLMEEEPDVGPYVELAAAAVASGRAPDMDAADLALAQAHARHAELQRARNAENDRRNERANAARAILSEQRGNIALTAFRTREAAEFFLGAARETPKNDPQSAAWRFSSASYALLRHGVMFFDNDALRAAIRVARDEALAQFKLIAPQDANAARATGALEAQALRNLAEAQSMLGFRTPGFEGQTMVADASWTFTRAKKAVDFNAYPAVAIGIEELRSAHDVEWARRSLAKEATRILDLVITTRSVILDFQTALNLKFERAGTLNNIANALHEASLRDAGEDGQRQIEEAVALLEEAVATFGDLTEQGKNIARANLGRALGARAARRPGLEGQADINRARDLFAEMNKTLRRDQEPWLWAYLKRFEAEYLRMVGERTLDSASALAELRTSLEMFQGVLAILSRETAPNDWAIISAEIGYTLVAMMSVTTESGRAALAQGAAQQFTNARNILGPGNFKWDLQRIDAAMKIVTASIDPGRGETSSAKN